MIWNRRNKPSDDVSEDDDKDQFEAMVRSELAAFLSAQERQTEEDIDHRDRLAQIFKTASDFDSLQALVLKENSRHENEISIRQHPSYGIRYLYDEHTRYKKARQRAREIFTQDDDFFYDDGEDHANV